MSLRIYNTLTRRKEAFVPLTPGEVRMYVCGITAYDLCHIGHARSAIVFDVIRRYLEYNGYRVKFIKNFTDVDDRIIKRASAEGVSSSDVSERFIAAYKEDMDSLGVLPARVEPRATEHLPQMIALIERLIAKGFAYVIDGDVYFEVRRFQRYGRLSGKNLDELLAGARVEVDERKRDPRDFALWKSAKPDEPSWASPWGRGRPGWHIECSAMSMEYLGESFDIHGGGEDLIFPHHECEVAQSEADTGQRFVSVWIHNGFVNLGAEKMSKSLGNTLTIKELVKRHDPDALRLWLLGAHYRSPVEFEEERVKESAHALDRLRALIEEARRLSPGRPVGAFERMADETSGRLHGRLITLLDEGLDLKPVVGTYMQHFSEAMDDDFNTPKALAALFGMSRELQRYRSAVEQSQRPAAPFVSGVRIMMTLAGTLGLLQRGAPAPEILPDFRARVEGLVAEREAARRRRDWKRADEIRTELHGMGVVVHDTPAGPRWKWGGT
jgi:cysteinyl-tRNA synthetase